MYSVCLAGLNKGVYWIIEVRTIMMDHWINMETIHKIEIQPVKIKDVKFPALFKGKKYKEFKEYHEKHELKEHTSKIQPGHHRRKHSQHIPPLSVKATHGGRQDESLELTAMSVGQEHRPTSCKIAQNQPRIYLKNSLNESTEETNSSSDQGRDQTLTSQQLSIYSGKTCKVKNLRYLQSDTVLRRVYRTRLDVVPLKQTYFIVQKPGVKLTKREKCLLYKEQPIIEKKQDHPIDVLDPDMKFYSITFRDSDSPTYDLDSYSDITKCASPSVYNSSDSKPECEDVRQRRPIVSVKRQRPILPAKLTGSAKVIHTRVM